MDIVKLNFYPSLSANTYVIGKENRPALVFDPGFVPSGNPLHSYLEKHHQGQVLGYFLTHAHIDHLCSLDESSIKAPLYLHFKEIEVLDNPRKNLSFSFLGSAYHLPSDIEINALNDGDELCFSPYTIKVIATPFHTIGSVCYYFEKENVLISGDTLFHLSIGRTDLPTGSDKTIQSSLKKLASLPPNTKIYPGHGEASTIKEELSFNPYFINLLQK